MSIVTKKQFLADVRHEIEMLKQNATESEIARLNINSLNANDINLCIYGQMTGDCTSLRAKDLMDKSCKRVFSRTFKIRTAIQLDALIPNVNGNYESQDWDIYGRELDYLSALEGYIYATDAKNAEIISYLKDETTTLTL